MKNLIVSVVLILLWGSLDSFAATVDLDNIAWNVGDNFSLGGGIYGSDAYSIQYLQEVGDESLISPTNPFGSTASYSGSGYGFLNGLGDVSGYTNPYCADGSGNCVLMFTFDNISGTTIGDVNVYAISGNGIYNYVADNFSLMDLSGLISSGTPFLSLEADNNIFNPSANGQQSYSINLTAVDPTTGAIPIANPTMTLDPNSFMVLSGTGPSKYVTLNGITYGEGQGTGSLNAIPVPEPTGMFFLGLSLLIANFYISNRKAPLQKAYV